MKEYEMNEYGVIELATKSQTSYLDIDTKKETMVVNHPLQGKSITLTYKEADELASLIKNYLRKK